jgi:ribosome biogenesis GTPase
MTPEEVRWYFDEFKPLAPACKFADCTHTHEPECAVKQALNAGRLSRARYESYCRLLASL